MSMGEGGWICGRVSIKKMKEEKRNGVRESQKKEENKLIKLNESEEIRRSKYVYMM